MKRIKLFEEFKQKDNIKEANIRPISDNYLDSQKEIQDENMVKDFFNYHGINPLALDIWTYMFKNHKQYPAVITVNFMRYSNKGDGDNVIVNFKKNKIELNKERRKLNSNGHSFTDFTMDKGPFDWKLLNKMIEQPS